MRYRNISIRKKILLSNFLMVLIPIIFVCFILFSLLLGFSFLTNSPSIVIRNVLLNSSNYGPTLLIKSMNDELAENSNLTDQARSIFHQLEKAGLHILIEKDANEAVLYQTKGYDKARMQKEFQTIARTDAYTLPYILWNQEGMAYQASIENRDGSRLRVTFSGTSLKLPVDSYQSWEHTKMLIKLMIVGTAVFMVFFIVALGAILTKKLSIHILKPLHELNTATRAIKEGKLDSALTTSKEDEIGELCRNFEAMRQQLIASQQLQQQYDHNRKELIAGISHDLSTPLTCIQGYVNGLQDGIANTPEKQQHYLSIIQDQTQAMTALVDSLFLLSKLDLGQEPFQMEEVVLSAFIRDWYEEHVLLQDRQDVHLTLKDTSDATCRVRMDRSHFLRVLDNLYQNSIKYKKADIVHIEVAITQTKDSCILRFMDDGIGVSEEEAARLFDSFYRSDPARSSKIKGNGLGLSIARQIITQMEGVIEAHGRTPHGLCITITLPIIQGGQEE